MCLNDEPQSTGTNAPVIVPLRMQVLSTCRVELAGLDELEERFLVHRERLLEQLLPQLRDTLDPFGVFRRRELETVADLVQRHRLPFRVLVVGVPDVADVRDEVGHADEFVGAAERDVAQERGHAETLLDARHALLEVRADAVHLVDVAEARDVVLVREPPVSLGLRLDARDAVEHDDRAVEHAQAAIHLDREVDVARRVDDVDLVAFPLGGDGSALDRDAALALLLEVVGRRAGLEILRVVDLDDVVLLAGVIEHALRRRGLARVDVGNDPDVAIEL